MAMPADATLILAAVKSALLGAYADIPVRTSKRKAAGGKQLEGGYQAGVTATCFVISCGDPEPVDTCGTFEYMSVGYVVTCEYFKPSHQTVLGAVDAGAAPVVEDPDVRDKRDGMRAALYKTLTVVPNAFDTRVRSLPPYDATAETKALFLVSGEEYTFTTVVPRPGV